MKHTKWHFELKDGKGGIIISPYPKSQKEVEADCRQRFGEERLREVTHGDEVDISTDRILLAAEERTAAIQASLQGEGQEFCEDCDCEIPAARRAAMPNAVRCAPCQEVFEAKGRVWR